jgi:hypothetical protein
MWEDMATVVEAAARNRLAPSPRLATRGRGPCPPAQRCRGEEPHPPTGATPGL